MKLGKFIKKLEREGITGIVKDVLVKKYINMSKR